MRAEKRETGVHVFFAPFADIASALSIQASVRVELAET